jgi:hypothetical protein
MGADQRNEVNRKRGKERDDCGLSSHLLFKR